MWGGVACVPVDSEDNPPTLISMLVTDIALLLIMLGGLFRLHRSYGGAFGLTQHMWKQVWRRFSLAVVLRFIDMLSFRRGLFGSLLLPLLRFRLW